MILLIRQFDDSLNSKTEVQEVAEKEGTFISMYQVKIEWVV